MPRALIFGIGLGMLLVCLGAVAGENAPPGPEEIRKQQERRQQLRQQIEKLQLEIGHMRRQKDALVAELAETERDVSALHQRLKQLDEQVRALEQKLVALHQEHHDLQARFRRDARRLSRLLRSAYMAGRQERLKLFLNQQEPVLFNRMLAYHDYISQARIRQLKQLRSDLDTLQQVTADISAQQQLLQETRAREEAQRRRLEQRQQARRKLLKEMDSRLMEEGERLARWQEDERRLGQLLEQIQSALQALDFPEQKDFPDSRGRLPWPLKGRLLKRFGTEKIGNLRWDGVIIGAREGDGVKAVHAGRVAWADWLRGYGLLMIIEHGKGYMTLYGNNQSLFKETGDWVEAGEIIAQAGDGGVEGNQGIYFGIRHKGKALNPLRWCLKRK